MIPVYTMREAYRDLELAELFQAMLLDKRNGALRVLVENPLHIMAASSVVQTVRAKNEAVKAQPHGT